MVRLILGHGNLMGPHFKIDIVNLKIYDEKLPRQLNPYSIWIIQQDYMHFTYQLSNTGDIEVKTNSRIKYITWYFINTHLTRGNTFKL